MKKITKSLFLTILTMLLFVSVCVGVFLSQPVNAEVDVNIAEMYVVGDTFNLPQVEMEIGGTAVEAKSTLISPDNKHTRKDSIVLDKAGKYEVRFEANHNGRRYRDSKFFIVKENVYATTGDGASIEYGTNAYVDESIKGLNVALPQGSSFRVNKIIDLSTLQSTDWFIKFFVTPENKGSIEFKKAIIKVIDAYDSNNYLYIENQAVDAPYDFIYYNTYAKAGAYNQSVVGLSWTSSTEYDILINNAYGTLAHASFYGTPEYYRAFEDTFVGFKYEPSEKRLLCNGSNAMVTDFDNTEFYDVLWDGFTTNEVFLELYMDTYSGSVANIFVTGIGNEDLTVKDFTSSGDSDIEIDFDGYDSENLPVAVVGSPYSIFAANVINPYDKGKEATVKVFYAYDTINQVEIGIENNAFIPLWEGEYFIEYSVANQYGVATKELVRINAFNEEEINPLKITYSNEVVEGVVGLPIKLANYTVEDAIGKYTVETLVELNGKKIEADSQLLATDVGIYKVKFIVKDAAGRSDFVEYDINVEYSQEIIFTEQPILPKYFSANFEYEIPSLKAYLFTADGKIEIDCKIKVKDALGERFINNNKFTPNQVDGEKVEIVYIAQYGQKQSTLSFEIECFEVYNGTIVDMTKLFVNKDSFVRRSATESCLQYIFNSDTSFEYINSIYFDRFSTVFSLGSNSISALNLYFEGRDNPNQVVKLTYKAVEAGVSVHINDGIDGWVIEKNIRDINSLIELSYDEEGFLIDSSASKYVKVDKFVSGEKFDGFTGGWANIKLETIGVNTSSMLRLNNLCGIVLSNVETDTTSPALILSGQYAGQYSVNKDFNFGNHFVMDIIDPNVELTVSITCDGQYIKDKNGLEIKNVSASEKYTINFEKYGRYTITFSAQDTFGNKIPRTQSAYILTIIDEEAPIVTLKGDYKTTAGVGEKITLAGVEVSDNYSSKDKIVVMVNVCHKSLYTTISGNTFVASEVGVYDVFYYVVDEAGNYSIVSYRITVNAKA